MSCAQCVSAWPIRWRVTRDRATTPPFKTAFFPSPRSLSSSCRSYGIRSASGFPTLAVTLPRRKPSSRRASFTSAHGCASTRAYAAPSGRTLSRSVRTPRCVSMVPAHSPATGGMGVNTGLPAAGTGAADAGGTGASNHCGNSSASSSPCTCSTVALAAALLSTTTAASPAGTSVSRVLTPSIPPLCVTITPPLGDVYRCHPTPYWPLVGISAVGRAISSMVASLSTARWSGRWSLRWNIPKRSRSCALANTAEPPGWSKS